MKTKQFSNEEDLLKLAAKVVREAEKNAEVNPTSNEIQIVIVEPNKAPYKKTIPNDLKEMQGIVGGWIESITIGSTGSGAQIAMIVNEEGRLIDLPLNRIVSRLGMIVGTFFITAYNFEGDNVTLSDPEADRLIRKFKSMEVYI
jgi:hypothetical protein